VLAISGGVGGAKLVLGLYRVLGPNQLSVVANTGDDFQHLGLYVCPDLDTLLYTLAGIGDRERGWGRAEETWTFMHALSALGGETWFKLGDADLATHVQRTHLLGQGQTLTEVTEQFCQRLGILARLLPMSDHPVRTRIKTRDEVLAFQDYFVRQTCTPVVTGFCFEGADNAIANPRLVDALAAEDLAAIIICPSNPYLSVDPILAVRGVREALAAARAPVVAVSPLIGGTAVKGPTDKIMQELGVPRTQDAIASHYQGLLDGFVFDRQDIANCEQIGVPTLCTNTLMTTLADRERLAAEVLSFADRLRQPTHRAP
jgi:LPPG:FO 2-phospho-L-lactate transferase